MTPLVGSNRSSLTTRMPDGVTNAAPWQTMGNSGIPDPTWSHLYVNDFDTYTAGDWTVTTVGTGVVTKTPFNGGAINLATSAGATDSQAVQLAEAGFQLLPGKSCFLKFSGQISDILNDTFFFGLAQAGATTMASITNGIFVSKDTATTGALTLHVRSASVDVSVPLPLSQSLVAGTPFELGIVAGFDGNALAYFNPTTGKNPIYASVAASPNGQSRGAVALLAGATFPVGLMAPMVSMTNASAVIRNLVADYIVVSNER